MLEHWKTIKSTAALSGIAAGHQQIHHDRVAVIL